MSPLEGRGWGLPEDTAKKAAELFGLRKHGDWIDSTRRRFGGPSRLAHWGVGSSHGAFDGDRGSREELRARAVSRAGTI